MTRAVHAGESIGLLDRVVRKTGAGYIFQSGSLDVLLSGNLPNRLSGLLQENGDRDVLGEDDGKRLLALKKAVFETAEADCMEVELPSSAGLMTFRIDLERFTAQDTDGILSVITDISETRHRERVLKTLLRELSHRSKNLLAIIQGIATQTARQALSLDSFLVKFRGRIQSLAYSQDLVTDSSWRGAFLFALAAKQFAAYWSEPRMPIVATGIDAHLSPNAALHIGLALHELIVNSASHGAIAAGMNSLTLDCFETVFDDKPALELAWIEHLPDADDAHDHDEPSFARTVLERVVPIAIAGKAVYITRADRIEYHLTIPAHEYEILAPIEG
ncbi:histidine kinase [Rhizobium sp. Leaf384]|uniref:sensor histidine kinase n=1 Tax=unclassified Rhizobium TaxID=2613769 RepID=UPI000713DCFF|nr:MULTISPECIES: sensor histidine kinase [unclassified Rhizobium]KQS76987.1 histidine kinase [Rhizobium sp. Leaf384]KQS78258.1 histidine kinase [Rhizobium sp. Leaf383]